MAGRADPAEPRRVRVLLRALVLLAAAGFAKSQDAIPYAEAGLGRRQGDFGTPVTNTLWAGYGAAGLAAARWDAGLTVPVLKLHREPGGNSGDAQGLGDLVLRGSFRVLPETEEGWSLDTTAALKLATASDTQGLGTGRTDGGLLVALRQRLGDFQWTLLAGRIQGLSPTPADAAEVPTPGATVLGLGGAWFMEGDRWGLAFEARGPAFREHPGARELTLDWFHPLTSRWAFKAALTAGLSDGGPRQGASVAVVRIFP